MSNTYRTITTAATVYDRDGFIQHQGATVLDCGDTIGINRTEHAKDDLDIKAGEIASKLGGWRVTWEPREIVENPDGTFAVYAGQTLLSDGWRKREYAEGAR